MSKPSIIFMIALVALSLGTISGPISRGPNEKSHNSSPPRKKNETSYAGQRECPDHDQDAVRPPLHNYEK